MDKSLITDRFLEINTISINLCIFFFRDSFLSLILSVIHKFRITFRTFLFPLRIYISILKSIDLINENDFNTDINLYDLYEILI